MRNFISFFVFFTFVSMNSLIQIIRANKICIQLAIFIVLGLILINRINADDFDRLIFQFDFSLILVILFMPVNWMMEYLKWNVLLKQNSVSRKMAKESFASGMLSDFVIPGIPSNFIGRIFYYAPDDRIKLTFWIQVSNIIQFSITILFGLYSLILLNLSEPPFIFWSLIAGLLLVILGISKPGRNLLGKFFGKEIQKQIQNLNENSILLTLIGYSFIRFIVFSIQFALLLYAFGQYQNLSIFFWIWSSYLFVTISPSLFMGNLVIRESITATVFSLGNFAILPVISATFLIWLINNFIPVVFAWFYITFRKKG